MVHRDACLRQPGPGGGCIGADGEGRIVSLIELLRSTERRRVHRFLQFSALAGVSSTYCFYLVMRASESPGSLTDGDTGFWAIVQFLVALLVFCIAQLRALTESSPIVELAVHEMRARLLQALQAMELRDAEDLGTSRIQTALSADAQTISQAAGPAAFAVQSAMMVIFAAIYLALISPSALALTVVVEMTQIKTAPWWQEAASTPWLSAGLSGLKPALPERFARYLP